MGGKKQKETKEKPLDKMTATELRELAKGIDGVSGVYGMNKTELIIAVKKARGIEDAKPKRADGSVRSIKQKLRGLRAQRERVAGDDPHRARILKRRISRLKKKTRRAA